MTPDDIERLARLARAAGLRELVLDWPGGRVRLAFGTGGLGSAEPAVAGDNVRAQTSGVFLAEHPMRRSGSADHMGPREAAAGAILGFVHAGACLTAVRATSSGRFVARVRDGAKVEPGIVLFEPV